MIYFKIGKIPLHRKGVFAPLLDYSTLPYRLLVREHNCDLCYTEMIHTRHIANLSPEQLNKEELLASTKEDKPTSLQLVGDFTDKKTTLAAARIIDAHKNFDIIDLNLGCPSMRIIAGRSGSAHLKDITKITPIIKELKETCSKPITVKTRLGYSKNEINFIYSELLKTGIDGIAIHARTAQENYSAPSRSEIVRQLLKDATIPIIYNGDINEKNYTDFLDFPALMVGRGALGYPQIFDLINNSVPEINIRNRIKTLEEYIKLCEAHPISFTKLKIASLLFIKEIPGSPAIRNNLSQAKSISELKEIIKRIKDKHRMQLQE